MEVQQRIGQQRVQHIVDSYLLAGNDEIAPFNAYLDALFAQYPHGLIELALVETLAKSWRQVPMQKGIPFLIAAHKRLQQWQSEPVHIKLLYNQLTLAQFSQITGLDAQIAFSALGCSTTIATQTAPD